MENLLSTSYPSRLVTVIRSLHQLKPGEHLTESERIWPLLQITGRGSVFSAQLEFCSALGISLHQPHPSLLHFALAVSGYPQWLRRAMFCSLL